MIWFTPVTLDMWPDHIDTVQQNWNLLDFNTPIMTHPTLHPILAEESLQLSERKDGGYSISFLNESHVT